MNNLVQMRVGLGSYVYQGAPWIGAGIDVPPAGNTDNPTNNIPNVITPTGPSDLQDAANALNDALASDGCAQFQSSNTLVLNFQKQFIAQGGSLYGGADGLYGSSTQAALAQVLGTAPNACVGDVTPKPAAPAVSPSVAPVPGAMAITSSGPTMGQVALIALGAGAAATGGWYLLHRRKVGAKTKRQ